MTTIAYNHKTKEVACDSRITIGGFVDSDNQNKMTFASGCYWFFSGHEGHKYKFINEFDNLTKTDFQFDCGAFKFDGESLFYCCVEDGVFMSYKVSNNDSIGSGRLFAISAMDFGNSASESVKYAMKRDCHTGGKINTYKLGDLEFK